LVITGITSIDLILHTAGIAAKSAINDKTKEDIVQVLKPKISGVENLIELAKSIQIDYLVNCSSISSIMPSIGNMEYTSANLYLDEISNRSHPNIRCMLAINLNQIYDTDMAVTHFKNSTSKMGKSHNSIKGHEFLTILEKLLQTNTVNNIILSRYDFNYELYENIRLLKSLNSITRSTNKFKIIDDNYTEIEFKIAQIWSQVLGIMEFRLHDNFFELGGHSLHATQVISKIRNEFNIELPLKTIFENRSIIELSRIIDSRKMKIAIKKIEKSIEPNFEQNIPGNAEDMVHEIEI
jgi:acyl carrier protein